MLWSYGGRKKRILLFQNEKLTGIIILEIQYIRLIIEVYRARLSVYLSQAALRPRATQSYNGVREDVYSLADHVPENCRKNL